MVRPVRQGSHCLGSWMVHLYCSHTSHTMGIRVHHHAMHSSHIRACLRLVPAAVQQVCHTSYEALQTVVTPSTQPAPQSQPQLHLSKMTVPVAQEAHFHQVPYHLMLSQGNCHSNRTWSTAY